MMASHPRAPARCDRPHATSKGLQIALASHLVQKKNDEKAMKRQWFDLGFEMFQGDFRHPRLLWAYNGLHVFERLGESDAAASRNELRTR